MENDQELRIQIEEADHARTIRVEGELTLMNAGALKTALLSGLRPGARTVLEAAGVTRVDVAGLQLLCSAHRSYKFQAANFEFGEVSENLRESALAAGYVTSYCTHRLDDNCLWRGGPICRKQS